MARHFQPSGIYRKDVTPPAIEKYGLKGDEILGLVDVWLETVKSQGVAYFLGGPPNAIGVLHRWGQLSEEPYKDVSSRMGEALRQPEIAIKLAMHYRPGIAVEGIEKLVPPDARQMFTSAVRESVSVPDAIKKRLIDYFSSASATRGEGLTRGSEAELGTNESQK